MVADREHVCGALMEKVVEKCFGVQFVKGW